MRRSGERSPLVAEQFALKQFVREGSAVDLDERFVATFSEEMQNRGKVVFSNTTLASDQYCRTCSRYSSRLLQ
jgi:hypothetical protein